MFARFRFTTFLLGVCILNACAGGTTPRDAATEGGVAFDAAQSETNGSCPPGQTRCADRCVDTTNDRTHCGRCGNACPAGANGEVVCQSGSCVAACAANFADCDGMASNGCEVDTNGSVSSCGGCGIRCPDGPRGTAQCDRGRCGFRCEMGFSDCNQYSDDGCESDLRADTENCGGCGMQCAWPPQSEVRCERSTCGFACISGYADCDRDGMNGCESSLIGAANCGSCGIRCMGTTPYCARSGATSASCVTTCPAGTTACGFSCVELQSDLLHCGACNNACRGGTNAAAVCQEGRCGLRCRAGYADCDGNPANGCEVNLLGNNEHCGSCGTVCPSGPGAVAACLNGRCNFRCNAGNADCDANPANACEAPLATDLRNCGRCGNACPSRPNASAMCSMGNCSFQCVDGFGNCDGDASNGCETNQRGSNQHCGACGNSCAAGQVCVDGMCAASACMGAQRDCDRSMSNGCEVDTNTDFSNCGACGTRCDRPNASAACDQGRCTALRCNAGFGDCNGDPRDGCETRLDSITHCGQCGRQCAFANALGLCIDNACSFEVCVPGYANCDARASNGCETDVRSDVGNCGECRRQCDANTVCMGGQCRPVVSMDAGPGPDVVVTPPDVVSVDADAEAGNDVFVPDVVPDVAPDAPCAMGEQLCGSVCVSVQTDNANCGMCGRTCAGSQQCVAGTCQCPAGQMLCGGACTDPSLDTSNCGMCGNACVSGQRCEMGMCQCPAGRTLCAGACVDMNADNAHCGSCGTTCSGGQSCAMGVCRCPMGQTLCGGVCVTTDSDPRNCGACGTSCSTGQLCVGGMCALNCSAPRMVCGTGATMACVDLQSDENHCGTCGNRCSGLPNTTGGLCLSGSCSVLCLPPFANCNGDTSDGCEANTDRDVVNCGACRTVCATRAGASGAQCVTGRCEPVCAANRANCDRLEPNGCEIDLLTSAANCGMCGRACVVRAGATGTQCVTGNCQPVCMTGRGNCDGMEANGCETDTTSSNAHCGMCGRSCGMNERCSAGMCVPATPASCQALLQQMPGTPSGIYRIDPDGLGGAADFEVFCDMTSHGGGWTLIGAVHNGTARAWNSYARLTDTSTFGTPQTATTAQYRAPAWATLSGNDLMVQTEEYTFGFRALLGARSFATYINAAWPMNCNRAWTRSGVDFATGLSTMQQRAFGFSLRLQDSNAGCFPSPGSSASPGNENAAIVFHAAECCWTNGIANTPSGQAQWMAHDLSLLRLSNLNAVACSAGVFPCNANGVLISASGECYDDNPACKARRAMVFVR